MKTAVIDNDKILVKKVDDISLDECRGALVKVLGCGLCGSDIVKFREKISPDGTVLGHEIVAEILDINSDTKFKKGDKIVTSHHIPCGECIYCKSGNVSMCEHFKKTNIKPGGFSELVYLSEEHLQNVAHLLPENLDEIEGAFYEPLGCCVRAVRRADLPKGSTVLVVGLGSIGILMAQALKSFGMNVIGCDLIDFGILHGYADRHGIRSLVDGKRLRTVIENVVLICRHHRIVMRDDDVAVRYARTVIGRRNA